LSALTDYTRNLPRVRVEPDYEIVQEQYSYVTDYWRRSECKKLLKDCSKGALFSQHRIRATLAMKNIDVERSNYCTLTQICVYRV
jgi:hypothetical protein